MFPSLFQLPALPMFARAAILALSAVAICVAEESSPLPEQPAPFSTWLDFRALARPGAADTALPIWFEGLQTLRVPATDQEPPKTLYRLRLRHLPTLQTEMLLRVFFDDLPEMEPTIRAWAETGTERYKSPLLGTGIGLSTSESVIVPLDGVDYVDLEVPGDGSTIRGAHVSSLKEVAVRQTLDFQAAPEVIEPFGPTAQSAAVELEDRKLYGRVQGLLDAEETRLSPETKPDYVTEVSLAAQPLAAMLKFEVLNADFSEPPIITVNGSEPVQASIQWPDLADPGYRGEARGDEANMRFQYTGWLQAQVVIPATSLQVGVNKIFVSLSNSSGPIAIRNLGLQLKQNWKYFDYILTPANR